MTGPFIRLTDAEGGELVVVNAALIVSFQAAESAKPMTRVELVGGELLFVTQTVDNLETALLRCGVPLATQR